MWRVSSESSSFLSEVGERSSGESEGEGAGTGVRREKKKTQQEQGQNITDGERVFL